MIIKQKNIREEEEKVYVCPDCGKELDKDSEKCKDCDKEVKPITQDKFDKKEEDDKDKKDDKKNESVLKEEVILNADLRKKVLADFLKIEDLNLINQLDDEEFQVGQKIYSVLTNDEATKEFTEEFMEIWNVSGLTNLTDSFKDWVKSNAVNIDAVKEDLKVRYMQTLVAAIEEDITKFVDFITLDMQKAIDEALTLANIDLTDKTLIDKVILYKHDFPIASAIIDEIMKSFNPEEYMNKIFSGETLDTYLKSFVDVNKMVAEIIAQEGRESLLSDDGLENEIKLENDTFYIYCEFLPEEPAIETLPSQEPVNTVVGEKQIKESHKPGDIVTIGNLRSNSWVDLPKGTKVKIKSLNQLEGEIVYLFEEPIGSGVQVLYPDELQESIIKEFAVNYKFSDPNWSKAYEFIQESIKKEGKLLEMNNLFSQYKSIGNLSYNDFSSVYKAVKFEKVNEKKIKESFNLDGVEITKLANNTSENEYYNIYKTFSDKEKKTHESLVKLGDSKEIALWTTIALRAKPDNFNLYYNAYYK